MTTLMCDLNVYDNGHHIAFVNSILEYSRDKEDIIFLFNREAATFCPRLEGDQRIFFVDEALLQKYKERPLIGKFREYAHIRQFALQHRIGKLVLLEIDQYQIAIGLIPVPFKVTGIYFRSFHMVRVNSGSLVRSLKNAVYLLKKKIMFRVLRLNRKVEPLFILNDRSASERYPSYFRYLPDPVFTGEYPPSGLAVSASREQPLVSMTPPSLRERYGIPPAAHVYLLFGAIGARKNITNIVAAYLRADLDGGSVLLIAGKVRADTKGEFSHAVNGFREHNKDDDKRLIAIDEFIADDEVDAYFKESDTIVLCYRKFYGSSGLMGKAALHDKTCIVSNEGLLNDLSRQYRLGYEVDPLSVPDIARALGAAEKNTGTPNTYRQKFVTDHSEKAFNDTILN